MGDRYYAGDRGDSRGDSRGGDYRRDDFRPPPFEFRQGGQDFPPRYNEPSRGGGGGGGGFRHDDRRGDDHRRGGDRDPPRGGGGYRVYVGDLPREIYIRDVEDVFRRFGRIRNVDVKPGFAFVEFSDDRDAQDAVRELHGRDIFGRRIRVEFAKAPRDRERTQEVRQRTSNPDCRVLVSGLTVDTSWQDLKDLGREAGNVTFADVTKAGDTRVGLLEFETKDMAQAAIRKLDGAKLKGNTIKAEEETPERTFRSMVEASRGTSRRDGGGGGGGGSSSSGGGGNNGAYGAGSSSNSYGAGSSSNSGGAYGSSNSGGAYGSSNSGGAYGASEGGGSSSSQTETAHPADDTRRGGADSADANQDGGAY